MEACEVVRLFVNKMVVPVEPRSISFVVQQTPNASVQLCVIRTHKRTDFMLSVRHLTTNPAFNKSFVEKKRLNLCVYVLKGHIIEQLLGRHVVNRKKYVMLMGGEKRANK